jgi:flagellar biogenesis protein FliO
VEHVFAWSSEQAAQDGKNATSKLVAFLTRICSAASGHRRERRLRLCETISLGEKRFVAVVEYGQHKFLLAGTPQNISLLQRLDECPKETNRAMRPETNPD